MDTVIGIQGLGQYDAARRGLENLLREFEEAADGPGSYPPLFHQLISPLDGPLTEPQWRAFIDANARQGGEWQDWDVLPGGKRCGRLFGHECSFQEFVRMAERGMELLRSISQMRTGESVILPGGLILRLPSGDGCRGWLQLLYETARAYSTPFLSAEPGYWGCTGQLNGEEDSVWTSTPEGVRYPVHPFYEGLTHNLFESSAEALCLWLGLTEDMDFGEPLDDTPIYLPPEPGKDGPRPPNEFCLWGKLYEFSPMAWRLLEFLWGRGKVKKEDAMRHVYGGAGDDERAFKSLVKRLQAELADEKHPCPAAVRTKKEYIWLEIHKPNPAAGRPPEGGSGVQPG
jgi:hypothetical protein